MAKPKTSDTAEPKKTFWQPPEKRGVMSEEGKKWLEENAEAIRQWNDWADANELPLTKYRQF
jgi:hypothetical protein